MFVVLLDNKRSDIAEEQEHFKALKCIRCGACLNACPIYKNIGGYTYIYIVVRHTQAVVESSSWEVIKASELCKSSVQLTAYTVISLLIATS